MGGRPGSLVRGQGMDGDQMGTEACTVGKMAPCIRGETWMDLENEKD
jgi:hypothetical protein